MGKQINYYMDYDSFILLAQKAIELGCEIISDTTEFKRGYSTDLITKDNTRYYFHIPEAGEVETKEIGGRILLNRGFNSCGISIIEADYSYLNDNAKPKYITRSRIYCISGYYDSLGNLIKRPECVTKIYDSLARYVKKIAPYTEVEYHLSKTSSVKEKLYITSQCLALVQDENYKPYC